MTARHPSPAIAAMNAIVARFAADTAAGRRKIEAGRQGMRELAATAREAAHDEAGARRFAAEGLELILNEGRREPAYRPRSAK